MRNDKRQSADDGVGRRRGFVSGGSLTTALRALETPFWRAWLELACRVAGEDRGFYFPESLAKHYLGDTVMSDLPPRAIERHVPEPYLPPGRGRAVQPSKFFCNRFIAGGDWDVKSIPCREVPRSRRIHDLFGDGLPYRESRAYREAVADMEAGTPLMRHGVALDSVESIDRYFEPYLEIFDDIKSHGYRPEAGSPIGVAIGRRGEFLHYKTGHHRLEMARILGVPAVRVRIHFLHTLWVTDMRRRHGGGARRALERGIRDAVEGAF